MPSFTEAHVVPARRVAGRLRVPGDKSISHRYALLSALADGTSRLTNYSPGADCAATLDCLRALGVAIRREVDPLSGRPSTIIVEGRGLGGLKAPAEVLDAQNSGTTTRLLAGILAAHGFTSTLTGDASLRRRPMKRVIEPLARMGASIDSVDGCAPLTIRGGGLRAIEYTTPVPSAQIKSAVLLAGLHIDGRTTVHEPAPTRNHTELAVPAFGGSIEASGTTVHIDGGRRLHAVDLPVPGDVSSATFWAVAAAALPGSDVTIEGVGLNPSRTSLFDVLARAGAKVERVLDAGVIGEPTGSVRVRHDRLVPLVLTPEEVPGLIDELPALAALASAGGGLHVTGAAELRVKESDRISALAAGFRSLGGDIDEFPDGFHIRGHHPLRGGSADAAHDHRLAMAFAIAGLAASAPTTVTGAEAVDVSYPGFFETLHTLVRAD
jgi:3-phosphoshikimate 1-carboxyvinyltransferase